VGDVLNFNKRAKPKGSSAAAILQQLGGREKDGTLEGLMVFSATPEGNQVSITGDYADDLQFTAFTLIKTLGQIADRIVKSDTMGHTSSEPFDSRISPSKRRGPPLRLTQDTHFGGLGT